MPYSDKEKQRKFQREHLARKKKENPKWNAELKKRQKMKRDTIHDIVNHIKRSTGCLLCDENDPKKLQFHHVVPELKQYTVAQLIGRRSKLIIILKEIDKCVCVCTACHSLLQDNLSFVASTIVNNKWYKDWGLHEALDWHHGHPQMKMKKRGFLEVIKAVIRNLQMQDFKTFEHVYKTSSKRF